MKKFGGKLNDFIEENKDKISEVFNIFIYGEIKDRKTYDAAINSITDQDK